MNKIKQMMPISKKTYLKNKEKTKELKREIKELKREIKEIEGEISKVKKDNEFLRKQIKNQQYLIEMAMPKERYNDYLKYWYFKKTGKNLDLSSPKLYSEKLQWLKINDCTTEKTRLTDKYLVREYISDKIGGKYLVKLLGVFDRPDEINFDILPERYVIKATHGSGYNIIVKDNSKIDQYKIRQRISGWLSENFAFKNGIELQYKDIVPRIIIEEYIENGNSELYDYKFFCFDGKVQYIRFLKDRSNDLKMVFFNEKWEKQPFVCEYPRLEEDVPRPNNLDEMINIAETLSKGFKSVRVDLYRLDNGEIKFGEMTFSDMSGVGKWNPEEYDEVFGSLIKL